MENPLTPQHQEVAKKLYEMLNGDPTSDIQTKLDILSAIKEAFKHDLAANLQMHKKEVEQIAIIIEKYF